MTQLGHRLQGKGNLMIEATVRGLGKFYKDGLEALEVHIPKRSCHGLPAQERRRVEISLQVCGHTYTAGMRVTPRNRYVWICPNLADSQGRRTTLARVFRSLGLGKNQRVTLDAHEHCIRLEPA